jgi:hypothetical protein
MDNVIQYINPVETCKVSSQRTNAVAGPSSQQMEVDPLEFQMDLDWVEGEGSDVPTDDDGDEIQEDEPDTIESEDTLACE